MVNSGPSGKASHESSRLQPSGLVSLREQGFPPSAEALSSFCTEAQLQVARTTLAGGLIVAIFIQ